MNAAISPAADPLLDGAALRGRLSEIALSHEGDSSKQRRLALEALQQALNAGRGVARARLEAGAGGLEVAQAMCAATDNVVTALWDFTTVHVHRARNPTEGERLALLAVGGYGRGVLAPFSDIDLLFLRPWKETPHGESVIEYMLYALWDLGLKVGHASRTVDDCIKLAKSDHTIATAILEARLLAGDDRLAQDLRKRFASDVTRGGAKAFVGAKLGERDARHLKAGASRYMVEPNVKDGKGGLRDLNTLFWITQYLDPPPGPSELPRSAIFNEHDLRAFRKAFDFLWAVRAHMHWVAGRAQEVLSFDLQPEVARRMGFGDRGDVVGVERFMRRYFMTAKEVGALTRALCAKLEARQNKPAQGLSRFLKLKKRQKLDVDGFVVELGRLNVTDPAILTRDPVNLLRLFRSADRHDLDLHPDAFRAVSRSLEAITPKVRRDPLAVEAFLDVLARGQAPARTLRLMNDAGLLGRFIPEFAHVVARTQFNMYHAYTVDEHTLHAIDVINDIENGRLKDEHPLATAVLPMIEDREALYLAMLLHDTGKGKAAGQEKGGAIAARRACLRMGLERSRVELVAWLVEHHLVLSDFAQKRDVSDPETIAAFARIVETPERLRLLLVVTVADIRAVGPGVWNGWKGQLMRELYAGAEAVFRGGRETGEVARAREGQAELAREARERLAALDAEALPFVDSMESAYLAGFAPQEQASHAALARRARDTGAAAEANPRDDGFATEAVIAAKDRKGLFADLAAAIAAAGANVVGARVFTSRDGLALDVFYLQDSGGEPYGRTHPAERSRLASLLERAARGEPLQAEAAPPPLNRRAAAFDIAPSVSIDNEASAEATVVEVSGRDRAGLLAALARCLSDAGLSILSAHVENYGERAVDAFYVTADGQKVRDPGARTRLKVRLLSALEPPAGSVRKTGLRRARSNVAR